MLIAKHKLVVRCLRLALIALCCGNFGTEPAGASPQDDDETIRGARALMATATLQLFMHTRVLEHFMQYKGSPYASPTVVWIAYKQKTKEQWASSNSVYEELWLHGGKAIGQRRYAELPSRQDALIYIVPFPKQQDQTKAIAGAIIHLLADLLSVRSLPRTFILPKEIYRDIEYEVQEQGFKKMDSARGGKRPIVLHLADVTGELEQYFYYQGGEEP